MSKVYLAEKTDVFKLEKDLTKKLDKSITVDKELFIAGNAQNGYSINASGNITTSSTFSVSDYIPVEESLTYQCRFTCNAASGKTQNHRFHAYDSNKNWLEQIAVYQVGAGTYEYNITAPTNCTYIRISFATDDTNFSFVGTGKNNLIDYIDFMPNEIKCPVVIQSVGRNSGANAEAAYNTRYTYRNTPYLIRIGSDPVEINISYYDADIIKNFRLYEYGEVDGHVVYLRDIGLNTFIDNKYLYMPSNDVLYIRLTLTLTGNNNRELQPLVLKSHSRFRLEKQPKIYADTNSIPLLYKTADGECTRGHLLLPPNYNVSANPVPLYVVLHGTSSMNIWSENIGINSGTSTRDLLEYMCNEGFAVFDCYPFTSKYYKSTGQIACAPLPVFKRAYIEGIKFVCEHFNVDVNNVCISALSLGGQMAYDYMHEKEIVPRAIALLAPSTGFASLIFKKFFLQKSGRQLMVDYLGLSNAEDANTFITEDKGLLNNTVKAFMERNLDKFAGMAAMTKGVSGATYKQMYQWMTEGTTTLPQWMTEEGVPAIPSAWDIGVPKIVEHPELAMHSEVPIKWWCAFDDTNVSNHANYAVYNWMKNGGTNVQWRTMPNGTGGHHAMDTDPNCLKTSGTTHLGIPYSDIPVAYVEMVEFFRKNMGI